MKKYCFVLAALLFTSTIFSQAKHIVGAGKEVDPYHYQIIKSIHFKKAAVVCAHPLAGEIGIAILKQGGNSFDAAIAVNLALAVVYPGAGNIGGGGFMMARKSNGKLIALDFREKAPSHASKDMYLDSAGNA